ncbi:hypothetical protein JOD57_001093 [Geodermatophilus bullaregiensis]|uniref:hypothetical protein n=1 Tax=Geodermatophilus bullaregiensis TaxID=1564160 RepID=UPI00195F240C|nr:hypothetical protein [Geodermatophilus bullaregiensis]MBM7805256.1 hypothetical protein [Geodermatophilus bullaregiensis]
MRAADAASSYTLGWAEDPDPRWDAHREALFATVPDELFPAGLRVPGRRLPGAWWDVTDGGAVVASCWLHEVAGRAVALLAVASAGAATGAAGFGTVRLGEAARERGLDRVSDVRRRTHPGRTAVTVWLLGRSLSPTRGPA